MDEGHQWPPSSHHLDHLEKKTHKNVGSILSPCFVNAIIIILTDWSVKYLSSMRAGVVRRWERNLEQWQRCQHGKFRRKCNLSQFPALCSAVVTVSNFHCSAERSLTRLLPGARLSTLAALKRELPSIWFSDQIVTHLNVFSQETLKTGNVLGGAPSNLPRIWFRGGLP